MQPSPPPPSPPPPPASPQRRRAQHPPLSDAQLRTLVHHTDPATTLNFTDPQSLLARLLIPREPASPGIRAARDAIDHVFAQQLTGWTIEHQPFTAATPLGPREMVNLVYTKHLGPPAPRSSPALPTLTLAAHYDSKYFPPSSPEYPFIGAIDSAAPCAMLVDVARALSALLEKHPTTPSPSSGRARAQPPALQFIFFDGEEAYHQWSAADSIYGARELADHWSFPSSSGAAPMVRQQAAGAGTSTDTDGRTDRPLPWSARASAAVGRLLTPLSRVPGLRLRLRPRPRQDRTPRRIDQMEHLVLLDLLGAPDPAVPSYFPATHWLHARLRDLETRLRTLGLLLPSTAAMQAAAPDPLRPDPSRRERKHEREYSGRKWNPERPFLTTAPAWGGIEDDHIPFLRQGVPVLHLIPSPFPPVWHRRSDDKSALHYPTVRAWSILTRVLAADYLGLAVPEDA